MADISEDAKVSADPSKSQILVTRPHSEAEKWVSRLIQGGFSAEALPMIDIAPASGVNDVKALQHAWHTLDRYAACMFVSGNAVKHFFKIKVPITHDIADKYAIDIIACVSGITDGLEVLEVSESATQSVPCADIPPQLRFLAPGPGTVAALLASGVPVGQIDAPSYDAVQFDSEALWKVVGQRDWQGRRVLIVRGTTGGTGEGTGSSGRQWMARQWQMAGAEVDFVNVYERVTPQLTPAQLARAQAAITDGTVWLFSSSEALANLTAQAGLQNVDWSRARAIATHPRIMETARLAGWGVVVASRPAFNDILSTLVSIESDSHE